MDIGNLDFDRRAYVYFLDAWFRERVEDGAVSVLDLADFAERCSGRDPLDVLEDEGIGGNVPTEFGQFCREELQDDDRMWEILPQRLYWEEWKEKYGQAPKAGR